MVGPFSISFLPIDNFMVNPLKPVDKKYTNSIGYRMITHHSAPHGSSVNVDINKHKFHIAFDTLSMQFVGLDLLAMVLYSAK